MNKTLKSILSILLSFMLVLSTTSLCFASETNNSTLPVTKTGELTDTCDCGEEPIIYVAALGSATLYKDAGTENETVVFRPETMTYVKLVFALLPAVFNLMLTRNYDAFTDKLIEATGEVFGPLANAEDGSSTEDITTKEELPTDPTHGLDYSYYFGYDFRADPVTVAADLDVFIDTVRELTGHNKVRLRASSMGGVITMAYLSEYGSEKIKSVIFQNCPISGTAVAGDLFSGNFELNATAVYRYAATALPLLLDDFTEWLVMGLVDFLNNTGILSFVIDKLNVVVENCIDRVYDELLIPVFKANCGIWAFVPDEYYEEAKAFMLGDDANETLVNRLDYYHYEIQSNADEILNGLLEDNIPVMIVSATNIQRTPLVETWHNDSDGTVDTKYSSVGATVANLWETLGDGYVQAVNDGHNHISPDNRIDASTCALPDNTWFINDMVHCTTHDGHGRLYRWFFENDESETPVNVFTNPEYPQFLQNNVDEQTLTPQQ